MTKTAKSRPELKIASITILAALALTASVVQANSRKDTAHQPASGVWVASGDVTGDGRSDTAAGRKLKQNGTTVGTAAEVQAPNTTERPHLLLPAVQKAHEPSKSQRAKFKQNGTTVATAGEVQAPQGEGQAALLLPAVQKVHEPAKSQRTKLKQNGTTVATAGEVQAPGAKPRAALLLPAVQKARVQPQPQTQRGRLEQNGTTVATASRVNPRQRN